MLEELEVDERVGRGCLSDGKLGDGFGLEIVHLWTHGFRFLLGIVGVWIVDMMK